MTDNGPQRCMQPQQQQQHQQEQQLLKEQPQWPNKMNI